MVGHLMRLKKIMRMSRTRLENIALTILTIPLTISPMSGIASTSGRLHIEFVLLLFLQTHREPDRFFAASGVQLPQCTSGLFHFRRTTFSSHLINLNLDGAPITSRTHTHPSHSQTFRLLTSSLSLGVPVPRDTQCTKVRVLPNRYFHLLQ